jgi:DNA repair protein RecO (recombination protein O)
MAVVVSEAIVLHAFDYLESSRILRLATREAGVLSVVARGARRPKTRFGTALDLFVDGTAHFSVRQGRELHTLTTFDIARARPALATGLSRFTGAAAVAELVLRFASEDPQPDVYDIVVAALDEIEASSESEADERALAGAWALIRTLGFTPALDACATCDGEVTRAAPVAFSAAAGGVLCARCSTAARGARTLPPAARDALQSWLAGGSAALGDDPTVRAHQRLLREFVQEHLSEGRPLRAFSVWEHERWSA